MIIGIVSNPGWYIIYGMFELLQGYNSQVAVTSATTDDATGETPAMMIMGHDLRLPVYLFIGRPEDEQPVQKTNYTQDLLNWLEKVHNYAQQHLKMKSCST